MLHSSAAVIAIATYSALLCVVSDQSQTALLPCPDTNVVVNVDMQEDLLTFVDVRTLKVKHEEQLKYEVCAECVPGHCLALLE